MKQRDLPAHWSVRQCLVGGNADLHRWK